MLFSYAFVASRTGLRAASSQLMNCIVSEVIIQLQRFNHFIRHIQKTFSILFGLSQLPFRQTLPINIHMLQRHFPRSRWAVKRKKRISYVFLFSFIVHTLIYHFMIADSTHNQFFLRIDISSRFFIKKTNLKHIATYRYNKKDKSVFPSKQCNTISIQWDICV